MRISDHVKAIHIQRNRETAMSYATSTAVPSGPTNIFRRAEGWLDQRGKLAWIAAMVLGFIFVWPVGLALLAYMIFAGKFRSSSYSDRKDDTMFCRHRRHHHDHAAFRSSGNTAFDAYKAETLKRLETEQEAFESFLQRLREAKDKQEFDSFMDERARRAAEPKAEEPAAPGAY
ncbi:hypothetical protein GCM10007291_00980 [Gemmobacter nanjingensis]|jgi:hypothetical protein|uniref:DUF2852 domain-containing protein n=2 Tax=Paracoccaceae TaxID=31989 RepID=A0ABQ3F647_9RHOB|nr:hypothetical protein GCM10007291_00980 [Gemmobacter nanjingensis]